MCNKNDHFSKQLLSDAFIVLYNPAHPSPPRPTYVATVYCPKGILGRGEGGGASKTNWNLNLKFSMTNVTF